MISNVDQLSFTFYSRSLATASIANSNLKQEACNNEQTNCIIHSIFRVTNSMFNWLKQRRQRKLIEIAISLKYAVQFFNSSYRNKFYQRFSLIKWNTLQSEKEKERDRIASSALWKSLHNEMLWYKIFQVPYWSKSPLTR